MCQQPWRHAVESLRDARLQCVETGLRKARPCWQHDFRFSGAAQRNDAIGFRGVAPFVGVRLYGLEFGFIDTRWPTLDDVIVCRKRECRLQKALTVAAPELVIMIAEKPRDKPAEAAEETTRDAITLLLAVACDPARSNQITAAVFRIGRENDFARLETRLIDQGGQECG